MPTPVTNADIMLRLDEIGASVMQHEKRLATLEADRAVVHRLAEHVSEISGEVRVIHDLLSRTEDVMSQALRIAGKELAAQMSAAVRAEVVGLRDDARALREAVMSRPCMVTGECSVGVKESPDA